MFGKKVMLFKLFGFAVSVDFSWLIIVALVTFSLATQFKAEFPKLSAVAYTTLGIVGALGLFASIVFHELCHSLVARRYGLPIKGITLFIFGGVSEMTEEPPTPTAEFWTGIAGPLSSIFLAALFLIMALVVRHVSWPVIERVCHYLFMMNGLLVVFNLIPAFPLDGGRVLRSMLWGLRDNLRWATNVASRIGSAFGTLLMALGLLEILASFYYPDLPVSAFSGFWFLLIGYFVRNAARGAFQQLLVRQALEGEQVRRFMNPNPVTVPSSITVQDMVENYIYKYHFKMFPVVEDGRLVGCISAREIQDVPRPAWGQVLVRERLTQCDANSSVGPDLDAAKALAQMVQNHLSRLIVLDGDRLVGIITLKDMLKLLSLKLELQERG